MCTGKVVGVNYLTDRGTFYLVVDEDYNRANHFLTVAFTCLDPVSDSPVPVRVSPSLPFIKDKSVVGVLVCVS